MQADNLLPDSGSPVLEGAKRLGQNYMENVDDLPLILEALNLTREAYMIMRLEELAAPGRILYVNPAFCRMTGYSMQEVTGTQSNVLWQGPPLVSFLKELREMMLDSKAAVRELICHRKDGTNFWVELQLVPVKKEGNRSLHWVGIMRDISDRKLMEQTLVDSQMRLNGLLNSLSDVVWSMDVDQRRFIYLSPATHRVFGHTVEEFFHDPKLWCEVIHPNDRERVQATFKSVLTTRGFEIEYRIIRTDGEVRWLRNKAHVICDSDGKLQHIDGLADDITSHKYVETRMDRMANFPRFNPNPIYELNEDGELTYANEAAETLARALGSDRAADILPKDTQSIITECMATGKARLRLEIAYGERTISWSFFPIPQTRIVHCYAGEITERIRLESQLRQSEKLKSVGQLAGGIAHDFNNILTIISGFTNLLLDRGDLDEDAADQLKQVAAATNKASDLTKQLLMFSRRQVLQTKTFNLNTVVMDLAKMLKRLLGEDIQLSVEEPDGDVTIHADQGMLEQVIVNLSSNSRDAMPRGGALVLKTCTVDVNKEQAAKNPDARVGRFACLSARDNGSGMDKETIARIFEPFFTTKMPGKGTGLGLSTVYGIIKQHDGWVEVKSDLGKGTSFMIFLPLAMPAVSAVTGLVLENKPKGGNETILVVEDEAPVRLLLKSILHSAGYKIIEAKHGLEALRKWDEHRDEINLLLTDLVMPGTINGIDLAERLVSERPDLKVIYSSGYSADVVGEKMAFDPGTNFLPKPYTPGQLLKFVRNCLDSVSN